MGIFKPDGSAGYDALDSLSCFLHGDAGAMEMTSHFDCAKGDAWDIYRKPLAGHWFPGNVGDA
jgi:maltooligosyltrehalose synthase